MAQMSDPARDGLDVIKKLSYTGFSLADNLRAEPHIKAIEVALGERDALKAKAADDDAWIERAVAECTPERLEEIRRQMQTREGAEVDTLRIRLAEVEGERNALQLQYRHGTPFDPTGAKAGTEIAALRARAEKAEAKDAGFKTAWENELLLRGEAEAALRDSEYQVYMERCRGDVNADHFKEALAQVERLREAVAKVHAVRNGHRLTDGTRCPLCALLEGDLVHATPAESFRLVDEDTCTFEYVGKEPFEGRITFDFGRKSGLLECESAPSPRGLTQAEADAYYEKTLAKAQADYDLWHSNKSK